MSRRSRLWTDINEYAFKIDSPQLVSMHSQWETVAVSAILSQFQVFVFDDNNVIVTETKWTLVFGDRMDGTNQLLVAGGRLKSDGHTRALLANHAGKRSWIWCDWCEAFRCLKQRSAYGDNTQFPVCYGKFRRRAKITNCFCMDSTDVLVVIWWPHRCFSGKSRVNICLHF